VKRVYGWQTGDKGGGIHLLQIAMEGKIGFMHRASSGGLMYIARGFQLGMEAVSLEDK
jgi:hypothetical protein